MAEILRHNVAPSDVPSEGRVPPQAVDIEMAVLGAMLLEKEAISKTLEILDDSAFYKPSHQNIFKAIVTLFERNEAVDSITLTEELRRRGQLDAVGGPVYISELTMRVTSAANVEYHAKIVLEKSLLRNLITASSEVTSRAFNETEDALDLLDDAEQKIFQISEKRMKKSFLSMRDAVFNTMEMLESIHGKHSGVTGVPSGFSQLDNWTGGFQASDLVIVAGRPSMGKTAFVLSVARNAAIDHGIPVGFFSLEMSSQQLVLRLICAEARVDAHSVRTGRLPEDQWKKLSTQIGKLHAAKIFIDDTPALGILELRAKARRLRVEHGIGMVVVDYLQLMQGPKTAQSREQEISVISRSLKALAKELNIPVLALSQLNRAVEARSDKRPVLADLRECVTGDTSVLLADGRSVPISKLEGQQPTVVTMTPDGHLKEALSDKVWRVGKKSVFKIRLASGRSIRATANHRLYTIEGWQQVANLAYSQRIAIARNLPEPRNTNVDTVPQEVFSFVQTQMRKQGVSQRRMAALRGTAYGGTSHFRFAPSRATLLKYAEILNDANLRGLATNDLFWDTIISIEDDGEEDVYDLTVPETSAWLANGIVSHNSGAIEQDADVVLFVHRPEMYGKKVEGDRSVENLADIIIGKQRNGPTAEVQLSFRKQYARFENLAMPSFDEYAPQGPESETPF